MLPVMSCATTKTEYKYVMPEYNMPEFPVCPGYEKTDDGNYIVVSSDWFILLAKFKNDYKEFREWQENVKINLKEGVN